MTSCTFASVCVNQVLISLIMKENFVHLMRSGSFEPMQTGILLFLFFRINHMPCRTCYFFVWDLHQANCH